MDHVDENISNGRPWRPMWVVVHATFLSGTTVVSKKDYHVYAESPQPGGRGGERWFRFGPPAVGGVTAISITTNKEALPGAAPRVDGKSRFREVRPSS